MIGAASTYCDLVIDFHLRMVFATNSAVFGGSYKNHIIDAKFSDCSLAGSAIDRPGRFNLLQSLWISLLPALQNLLVSSFVVQSPCLGPNFRRFRVRGIGVSAAMFVLKYLRIILAPLRSLSLDAISIIQAIYFIVATAILGVVLAPAFLICAVFLWIISSPVGRALTRSGDRSIVLGCHLGIVTPMIFGLACPARPIDGSAWRNMSSHARFACKVRCKAALFGLKVADQFHMMLSFNNRNYSVA